MIVTNLAVILSIGVCGPFSESKMGCHPCSYLHNEVYNQRLCNFSSSLKTEKSDPQAKNSPVTLTENLIQRTVAKYRIADYITEIRANREQKASLVTCVSLCLSHAGQEAE